MDVKHAASVDDEADLVFVVPVFAIELRQHRFQSRCQRVHIDYIRGYVSASRFEGFNLARVSSKDLLGRRVGSNFAQTSPIVVIDPDARAR